MRKAALSPGARRILRRTAWWLLGIAVLALGVGSVFVLPRVGAIRFLLAMRRPAPEDGVLPAGMRTVADPTLGPRRMRLLAPEGGGPRPAIVVVHGVTDQGIDDGRLLRLATAVRDAGFVAVVPELEGLVRAPSDGGDEARLLEVLRAAGKGRLAEVDPSRFGVLGVSVGGPLALAAAARYRREGGEGLRAVCLVGAPDDVRRTVRAWFAEPLAPEGATKPERDRSDAAEFARNRVHRAGVDALVPEEDRAAVRGWLESAWTPKGDPDGLRTEAARAFVERVRRGTGASAAEVEGAIEAGWPTLRPLSTAHAGVDPAALRGLPVFLVHGVDDPLVPVTEMPLLAERLRPHADVRTLRSLLLGHVEVGSQEAWDHVLFLDGYFDAVADGERRW